MLRLSFLVLSATSLANKGKAREAALGSKFCQGLERPMTNNVSESIRGISSTDENVRKRAEDSLRKHIKTESGVQALLDEGFKTFEALIEGGERGVVAMCMSRMCRFQLMTEKKKGVDDWDQRSLTSYLGNKFDSAPKDVKDRALQAVRYFALARPGNALLVQNSGWVSKALSCKKKHSGPAMLLLEACMGLQSFPEVVYGAADSEDMLEHVISTGGGREQVAALRVASWVVSEVEAGPPAAAAAWLTKLHNKDIIRVVLERMRNTRRSATMSSAMDLQLSKHQKFSEQLENADVRRDLVYLVAHKGRFGTSMSVLLHQALTSEEAANRFTAADGCKHCLEELATASLQDAVSRDIISVLSLWMAHATGLEAADAFSTAGGLKTCLGLLNNADPEAVKRILALLEAWSGICRNPRLAFEQRPDLWRLLGHLTSEDEAIANSAGILVSYALDPDSRDSPDLAQELKDEAIKSLVPFFAGSSEDARSAVGGICRLVQACVRDTESADRFAAFGVLRRLLMVMSGDCPGEPFVGGLWCLHTLVIHKKGFLGELEGMGAVGNLIAHFKEEEVTWGGVGSNSGILWLVSAVVFITGGSRLRLADDVSTLKKLLKVSEDWPSSQQWPVFQAVFALARTNRPGLAALDPTCKELCMQLIVAMLRDKPHDSAASAALWFLGNFLSEPSAFLGQAFITAGGPELLVSHVTSEDADRNFALAAVETIADNEHLADVMAKLEQHANMDLAALRENYPRHNIDNPKLTQDFYAVFCELPQWPSAEVRANSLLGSRASYRQLET